MTVIYNLLIMLAMFYLLAIVCDKLFVPALEKIAEKLKMSAEFAGATLMAIWSSAPELFTSIFAIFNTNIGSEVWAGTIVWSAIFNILVIIWASAMVRSAKVNRKPIVRDLIFYTLTITLLFMVFRDGKVVLRESIMFVLVYIFYIFIVKNRSKRLWYHVPHEVEDVNDEPSKLDMIIQKIFPDKLPGRNLIIFIVSIGLIALLTNFMVNSGVAFARWIWIPEVIVGLTILAAWTSVPDLISSMIASKKWHWDMAIANWIWSNIFDILFWLGLPYLLYFIFVWWPSSSIVIDQQGLNTSMWLLFATVLLVLFTLILKRRKITRLAWLALVLVYLAYVIRSIINILL